VGVHKEWTPCQEKNLLRTRDFLPDGAHAKDGRVRARREPATVESVLATCLDRALGAPGASAIWRVWSEAVGATIARRAEPVRLRGRTLVVAVSSAPWMQELTLLKRTIVSAVNARLATPLVDDLFFVLTEGRAAATVRPPRRAAPCPPPPARADLDALPDPLRASFAGVLQAWHRRARSSFP
jgi:predicted nucleic acid-binding Zn ribbon protein